MNINLVKANRNICQAIWFSKILSSAAGDQQSWCKALHLQWLSYFSSLKPSRGDPLAPHENWGAQYDEELQIESQDGVLQNDVEPLDVCLGTIELMDEKK